MKKKLIKTTLSDGTVIKLEKKEFLKLANYNAELCDYDYLHKLNEEQRNYLNNFNDEYYNGTYTDYSVFLPKKISNKERQKLEIELKKENDKRTRLNFKRKKPLKIIENVDEYQLLLQKREAKSAKNKRSLDYFNNCSNESNGNYYSNSANQLVFNLKPQQKINHFDAEKYSLEEFEQQYHDRYYFEDKQQKDKELLCYFIKENKVEQFLSMKLIELITTKIDVKTDIKDTLINVLENYIELSKEQKITKIEVYKALYRIYAGIRLIVKDNDDEDIVMLKAIFDNYIYNKIAFKKDLEKGE